MRNGKRVRVVYNGFYGPIECNGIQRGGCVEVLDYPEIVFMSAEEAKARQDDIAQRFDLSWYYGTKCEKCCGVYPKSCHSGSSMSADHYYQCEVCGKRTEPHSMPWISREAWNARETFYENGQMGLWECAS